MSVDRLSGVLVKHPLKERPILFSGPMVRAILDGRKTETRRVCNPQPKNRPILDSFGLTVGADPKKDGEEWLDADCINPGVAMVCKYGYSGDRLWVKETFIYRAQKTAVIRRAELEATDPSEVSGVGAMYGGWKPSIFMPRWASRITLEITSVRVERLQEISEGDARCEGVDDEVRDGFARAAFVKLWQSINAKRGYGWQSNPWVWVITFKKL
jgi:hypothetical protein